MIIRTERLALTNWTSEDWTRFRPIAQDPEVMRYINGGIPWTDEKVRNFIDRQIALYASRGFCRWKLIEQSTSALIGFCGPGFWSGFQDDPEIGWWLARHRWGCGMATEAARAALRDAFERCGLNRLVSVAMTANAASRRIMEKLGLRPEAEFENDGFQLVRYAISRPEYELGKGLAAK